MNRKIGVLIVAYNAVNTLAKVLDRIPPHIRDRIAEVFVFDDCSKDDTYLLGVGYKAKTGWDKLKVFRNEKNLGYGGNQKKGYRYAIENGFDTVVLLHGDGQYAPEIMDRLLDPIDRGEAEAVFGSRMMEKGAALRGGMPFYKYTGNKILTVFENRMLGLDLTEFHSGYRAYDVHALAKIPFEENSDDFHFDTEIIVQLHHHKMRIVETPIPTYYGDEICYVNGMKYAGNVVKSVFEYRLHQAGIKSFPKYAGGERYPIKRSPHSSHAVISRRIQGISPRILDVGCGPGNVAAMMGGRDFECVGVDMHRSNELDPSVKTFHERDIERDFNLDYDKEFDYIVFADVLEHLRNPEQTLRQSHRYLKPGGTIVVSVPNVLHWSVRFMMLAGFFSYTERGILDRTHLRFFTQRSMRQLLEETGYRTVEVAATPVPLTSLVPAEGALGRLLGAFGAVQAFVANAWKNLFAYQLIFVARDASAPGAEPIPAGLPPVSAEVAKPLS